MKNRYSDLLRELVSSCGISGYSSDINSIFFREAKKLNLNFASDCLDSASVVMLSDNPIPGITKRVMLSAHVDSPGYMVTNIDYKSLELVKIGNPVLSGITKGLLKTVYGFIDVEIVDGGEEDLKASASILNEKEIPYVNNGDPVYFSNTLLNKPNGKFTGPRLDNKAGILVLLMVMEKLSNAHSPHNFFFVLPALEELGSQGIFAAVNKIKPMFVINIDTYDTKRTLSKGPAIHRGPVYNSELVKFTEGVAKENNIPYKIEALSEEGYSDADKVLYANGGTPCCEIGIPCFNLHSNMECVSKKDIELTFKLVYKMCMNLEKELDLIPGGFYGV